MEEHDRALCEHYGRMLGLTEGWTVGAVDLKLEEQRLLLRVEWTKRGAKCPGCGQAVGRHDLAPERRWRHLDAMGFETQIVARVPRAECAEHGASTMETPWAGRHGRFTLAFEAFAIKVLLASRSVAAAAELLGLGWDGVQAIMDRAVERGLDRRSLEGITTVGMDEKSFRRGQSYASLLYDLDPAGPRVIEMMEGRDTAAAELLWETLPERQNVAAVALDMSGIYARVAEALAPQAAVVHDRFHVSKHLNEAVDKVRRAENATLKDQGDERLKGTRSLFLFAPENLPEDRVAQFEKIKRCDLKSARAWAIKESLRAFWSCRTVADAQRVFSAWYAWAIRCRLLPIIKVARMLKAHEPGLLNFARFPITNAVAEGFNSKIQALKADARGFRSFLNYRSRVLFFCGKLHLFPAPSH